MYNSFPEKKNKAPKLNDHKTASLLLNFASRNFRQTTFSIKLTRTNSQPKFQFSFNLLGEVWQLEMTSTEYLRLQKVTGEVPKRFKNFDQSNLNFKPFGLIQIDFPLVDQIHLKRSVPLAAGVPQVTHLTLLGQAVHLTNELAVKLINFGANRCGRLRNLLALLINLINSK